MNDISAGSEYLKIHGYTSLDDLEREQITGEYVRELNLILPGRMFAVYDASDSENFGGAGVYVVEYNQGHLEEY